MTAKAKIYALEMIQTSLETLIISPFIDRHLLQPYILYCMMRTHHGFLPLNRYLVPLGLIRESTKGYDPETWYFYYPFIFIGRDYVCTKSVIIDRLTCSTPLGHLYLFTGSTNPLTSSKKMRTRYIELVCDMFNLDKTLYLNKKA